jgi:hypothetical protein
VLADATFHEQLQQFSFWPDALSLIHEVYFLLND